MREFRKKKDLYIMMLRCEYDNLIKLREICEEIVDPRPFCCTPAMLALCEVIGTKMGERSTKGL